jgi:hypothetical protein
MISFAKFFKTKQILMEGGNVFDETAPIKKEHINPTLKEFFKQFGEVFPKAHPHFEGVRTLGSVGKKDYSGDIDLALSEDSFKDISDWGLDPDRVKERFEAFKKRARTSTDKQLTRRAVIVCIAEKILTSNNDILVDVKGSGSGTLFCQFPQYDEQDKQTDKYVQIDVNVGDIDWLTFSYHSVVYKGNVKGLHRTQLLIALFAHKGLTFSHNYGVKDKESQKIVATSPKQAIELLNKLYGTNFTSESIGDYFKVMQEIKSKLSPEDLNAVYDTYLKILDSTRADIPEDLQQYWVKNQDRLQLRGKFLPSDSTLTQYKKGE